MQPVDLKQLILDTLETRGHSRYWLAEHEDLEGAPTPAAIYAWLRGEDKVDVVGQRLAAAVGAWQSAFETDEKTRKRIMNVAQMECHCTGEDEQRRPNANSRPG